MELKWLGTAGFEFKTGDHVFLVDPFVSRNPYASPKQGLNPGDMKKASRIFISHGHFDHILDVPQIALQTKADIYCSEAAGRFLKNHQVDTRQIKAVRMDKKTFHFQGYDGQAVFSNHIKFDAKLVLSTLLKINMQVFKLFSLFQKFPCGQVLSWRFYIEGKIIQFFGSAGSSLKALEKMGEIPIDILLLPLQGHSDICRIGVDYVTHLKPRIVIPHHYDNFFPPISKVINIQPFVNEIKKQGLKTRVVIPEINEVLRF